MTETLHFLPWLRSGLGLQFGDRDTGQTNLPRTVAVDAYIAIDGEARGADLALRPADHAIAIDESQIARCYPSTGTPSAEFGYFPHIEFVAPDLPWLLTPATANETSAVRGSTGRLRPWLVLVCVPVDRCQLIVGSASQPTTLTAEAAELPDLAESYAWAHVQSAQPVDDLSVALDADAVIARLVCPRRLDPETTYRAAVVNAFRADGDLLVPAWSPGDSTTRPLTVYTTWTFTTGSAGSFEELCERLGPVQDDSLVFGLNPIDVTHLGLLEPWPGRRQVTVDYTGALFDDSAPVTGLPVDLRKRFEPMLIDLLDQGEQRTTLDIKAPDPVVTPPLYGSYATDGHGVPSGGWQRDLNLTLRRRTAAGLGARLVRTNQERFMARAWEQAGALRETNRILNFTRLQAEVGRTWNGRASRLDATQHLAVVRSQLSFVRTRANAPVRPDLDASSVPNSLLSTTYLRRIRPGSVVAAAAAIRSPRRPDQNPEGEPIRTWQGDVDRRFSQPATRRDLGYGLLRTPDRMGTRDDRRVRPAGYDVIIETPPPSGPPDTIDLDTVSNLASTIDPVGIGRRRAQARITGLEAMLSSTGRGDDELPTRVRTGPVIREALSWSLLELSPDLLMPGVSEFPDESVRLVVADPAFTASLLSGANHEMNRELLWREYPAELGWTTFRRFWDRPDPTENDIEPMSTWQKRDRLEFLGAGGGESVVLLIRGELIRQYPTVRIMLLAPGETVAMQPSFVGRLPPDIRFIGFDVEHAEDVTNPPGRRQEYQVIIEEQPSEPRFGLDSTDKPVFPLATYDELSWQHLLHQGSSVHLQVAVERELTNSAALAAEATWGLNGAHTARATYQKPFRRVFWATDLIGGST
ncbi:MAG: hypothetical protein WBM50_11945 [Acidimicrobiales bacterium]